MMNLFQGARVPLKEGQFIDAATARFYDEHAQRFMGPIFRRFAARAVKVFPAGKRVLDIGTGSGCLAIELAKARPDWQIIGIDISEEMLNLARQNAAESNLADRIDFQRASAEALPFIDGYFDLVTSNASLHLWSDSRKIFKEIARVTAPGGYCQIWDNLRLTRLTPLLNLVGRAMGMNSSQRSLWMQAIRSAYSIGEAKAILRESALSDARVIITEFLELGIEWRKH
jgi:ubiquinone/menaquinone biosynthesis C-methylase UbiE